MPPRMRHVDDDNDERDVEVPGPPLPLLNSGHPEWLVRCATRTFWFILLVRIFHLVTFDLSVVLSSRAVVGHGMITAIDTLYSTFNIILLHPAKENSVRHFNYSTQTQSPSQIYLERFATLLSGTLAPMSVELFHSISRGICVRWLPMT